MDASVLSDPRTLNDVSQLTRNQIAALMVDQREFLVQAGFPEAASMSNKEMIKFVEELRNEGTRIMQILATLGDHQDFLNEYRHLLGNCACGPQPHDLEVKIEKIETRPEHGHGRPGYPGHRAPRHHRAH